jgi:hypothetical protein
MQTCAIMPQYTWFQHIPLGSREHRRKDALRKCRERGGDESTLRIAPCLSSNYKIRNHAYAAMRIGQHLTHSYRLSDIAAIYGLHPNTVLQWYRKGMLPMPHHISPTMYRSWGWQNRPVLYLREQVRVICKVLDDIYSQGVTQFRQSHTQHIQMMLEGDAMVHRRLPFKAVKRALAVAAPKPTTPLRKRPKPSMRPLLSQIRADLQRYESGGVRNHVM